MAEAPGESVCEPITYSELATGVIFADPTGKAGLLVRISVLEPATIWPPPGARLYSTPDIVMAEAPGARVCEPTTYPESAFGVILAEPIVTTVVGCGCKTEEEEPTTRMVLEPSF
jgi:hypothetical protein